MTDFADISDILRSLGSESRLSVEGSGNLGFSPLQPFCNTDNPAHKLRRVEAGDGALREKVPLLGLVHGVAVVVAFLAHVLQLGHDGFTKLIGYKQKFSNALAMPKIGKSAIIYIILSTHQLPQGKEKVISKI